MISWTLPLTRPCLGVRVTAGQGGAEIPAEYSKLLIAGVEARHMDGYPPAPLAAAQPATSPPQLAARFAPTDDIVVQLAPSDLARVLPSGSLCAVVAHVIYPDAERETFTRMVLVDDDPPTGVVAALVTAGGTFLAYHMLSPDVVSLNVQTASGVVDVAVLLGGGADVILAENVLTAPLTVTATDASGNVSGDLLLHVAFEYGESLLTPLADWPLTPDLDASQPVISAFLRAFALALDLRPDEWGRELNIRTASDANVQVIAAYFGILPQAGETTADLIRRTLAVMTPNKATLAGLGQMLKAEGMPGAVVQDARTVDPYKPLTFDGSWTFDGSQSFNGGNPGLDTPAGVVVATFKHPPPFPLTAVAVTLNRYAAAGIQGRARLDVRLSGALGHSGLMRRLKWRLRAPAVLLFSTNAELLSFDGSWTFDGSQSFSGIKWATRPPTPI